MLKEGFGKVLQAILAHKVKTALIANHGLSDRDAAASISAYQLQERFDLQPYIQLHYDVEDIADEIIEEGYSAASSH